MKVVIGRVGALIAMLCGISIGTAGSQAAQVVPVPRAVIYSGDLISNEALDDRELQLGSDAARLWHLSRSSLVGKVARRTLLPGQAVPLLAVRPPDLVQAGKPVVLVFAAGQLTISGSGIAMQAGARGTSISVQNLDSNTIVRGVVAADGSVWVGD